MGFIQHQIPPFYCRRTFSDKFNDTTNFITSNWRILLKMLAIVLLPLCAIQALNINGLISSFYGNVQDGDKTATSTIVGFVLNYCSLFVFSLVATALFISIVYALMRLYHSTNDDGTPQYAELSKMTFTQFRPFMMRQMRSAWKSIGAMVLIGILMLVLFVAIVVLVATTTIAGNGESGIVFIVLLVYSSIFMLVPPLMMVIPAYSFEETKFLNGLKKGVFYYTKQNRTTNIDVVRNSNIQIVVSYTYWTYGYVCWRIYRSNNVSYRNNGCRWNYRFVNSKSYNRCVGFYGYKLLWYLAVDS